MDDLEILKDRRSKYGPPELFFETYGEMCRLLDRYAEASGQDTVNDGHLMALKMVLLKVLRSTWNPAIDDNYCDGRNYFTIAEMMGADDSALKNKLVRNKT